MSGRGDTLAPPCKPRALAICTGVERPVPPLSSSAAVRTLWSVSGKKKHGRPESAMPATRACSAPACSRATRKARAVSSWRSTGGEGAAS